MKFRNSLDFINEFYLGFAQQIRKIYLSSNIYDKKISKVNQKSLSYRPSLNILSCLVKYEKKKNKIEDFEIEDVWENNKLEYKEIKKLNNFFWLFSIDLKSSKKISSSILDNWIKKNQKYSKNTWEIDTLSKRIISWISNSKLIYDEADHTYKKKFNKIIYKQINHLLNEINRSDNYNDKLIGCTAVILVGLSYNDENFLDYGLNLLKKIINTSFDNEYFPKSRNIRQLTFYLKYFVLIRELLKDSSSSIPDYLDEIIFHLGKAYDFVWGSSKQSLLFNGNHESDFSDFDKYLSQQKYSFKNIKNELGGYGILKNKNLIVVMDMGSNPDSKFSEHYQGGPLSIEIIYKGKKLICNSGYFQDTHNKLNLISRSSAAHSTLIIDNSSVTNFSKKKDGKIFNKSNFKSFSKNIVFEKNYWLLKCSHDGFAKKYGIIHERSLEFYPEKDKFIGIDKIIKNKDFQATNFEIRFHLMPNSKVTKTQDSKTLLIELENSGWKFYSDSGPIDVETGLYFGKKNSFIENQNIYISGQTQNKDQEIRWEITKI